jgi:hypothetical protein
VLPHSVAEGLKMLMKVSCDLLHFCILTCLLHFHLQGSNFRKELMILDRLVEVNNRIHCTDCRHIIRVLPFLHL